MVNQRNTLLIHLKVKPMIKPMFNYIFVGVFSKGQLIHVGRVSWYMYQLILLGLYKLTHPRYFRINIAHSPHPDYHGYESTCGWKPRSYTVINRRGELPWNHYTFFIINTLTLCWYIYSEGKKIRFLWKARASFASNLLTYLSEIDNSIV